MITAGFIKKIDDARVKLSECLTQKDVEKTFNDFKISDYPSKIALLRRCMQIQKTENSPNNAKTDEDVYKNDLAFFLTGKWRNTHQESIRFDSNLSDNSLKKQVNESNAQLDEKICNAFNLSAAEYQLFKDFYETSIKNRMQKKYLSQLISVVEDMIDEKIRKQIESAKDQISNIIKANRYKIILTEFKRDLEFIPKGACSISFPYGAIISYNPNTAAETIRILIARELGHLLFLYGIIPFKNIDIYANLFAFFAINGENNLYTLESFQNPCFNEMKLIENIKTLSFGI